MTILKHVLFCLVLVKDHAVESDARKDVETRNSLNPDSPQTVQYPSLETQLSDSSARSDSSTTPCTLLTVIHL